MLPDTNEQSTVGLALSLLGTSSPCTWMVFKSILRHGRAKISSVRCWTRSSRSGAAPEEEEEERSWPEEDVLAPAMRAGKRQT